jgi:tRNA dimethylallyltransferase
MSALGYRECVAVLRGEMSQAEAIIRMKRATRKFVRKQANWFKNDDAQIRWFEAGDAELFVRTEKLIRNWLEKTVF